LLSFVMESKSKLSKVLIALNGLMIQSQDSILQSEK